MGENEISEVTRRAIFDFLSLSSLGWSGRLPEDDFLARLYDLAVLPSTDYRFRTAAADIQQHRVNWGDWASDWVFHDSRFNLLHGPDEQYLRFLAETVHPVVRPDEAQSRTLVAEYNEHLAADGWALVEARHISGRPVFVPARGGKRAAAFEEPTGWVKVDRQLQEARLRLQSSSTEEQFQAVGLLCREVLISVALEVFDSDRHPSMDGKVVSPTDAGRMLEAFIANELGGGANEEARAHGKAALKLALALQHKRSATVRMAALCYEATASVTNVIAILDGRRS